MMNCKKIAAIVSHSRDRRLSFWERLVLRMHLAMCLLCRRFSKQLDVISRLASVAGDTDSNILDDTLPPEAKARMRRTLAGQNPPESV